MARGLPWQAAWDLSNWQAIVVLEAMALERQEIMKEG